MKAAAMLILWSLSAAAARAQLEPPTATPAQLGRLIGEQMLRVTPFQPEGIDLSRGFVADFPPKHIYDGACKSQRLTYFVQNFPREAADAPPSPGRNLRELALQNRYREPGWARPRAPVDCGDPAEGTWTIAPDDATFSRAASLLRQLTPEGRRLTAATRSPRFVLTCTDIGRPCDQPEARLDQALKDGVLNVAFEGQVLVASHAALGYRWAWVMRITPGAHGAVARVELTFPGPVFS